MKTKELIEQLKKLDPDGDMEVRIEVDLDSVAIDGVCYEDLTNFNCIRIFNLHL